MQPTSPPAPPEPPAPPSLPEPADPTAAPLDVAAGAVAGVRAAPRTAQDIAGIREQRKFLSDQLVSAQRRRADVARAVERADNPANRAGLEQRLGVLDRRIMQLESDIAETGRLITSAPPALLAGQATPFRIPDSGRGPPSTVVGIMFILFVLFPLVLAFTRRMWRGTRVGAPDPAVREAADRLGRLEQAVEAIAIEVERVSEGQRFVTRLLAEPHQAAGALAAPGETADVVPRGRVNG